MLESLNPSMQQMKFDYMPIISLPVKDLVTTTIINAGDETPKCHVNIGQ